MIAEETLQRIRELEAQTLAERLGLESAPDESKKYACPECPSSDAYRIKPEPNVGGNCFSCGTNHSDNIAMTQAICGLDFPEAARQAASACGIPVEETEGRQTTRARQQQGDSRREAKTSTPPKRVETEDISDNFDRLIEAITALGKIYRSLSLEPEGRAYLADKRSINHELAEKAGVKSVSSSWWQTTLRRMPERLRKDAGLYQARFEHALIFPYFDSDGTISTFRLRPCKNGAPCLSLTGNMTLPRHAPKHLSPHQPEFPFLGNNSPRIAENMGLPLYVVEGELDALSVSLHRPAIGIPGTGNWRKEWLRDWTDQTVIVVGDADKAGQALGDKFKAANRDLLGENRNVYSAPIKTENFPEGTDTNDFLSDYYGPEGLESLLESLESNLLDSNRIEQRAAE